MKQNLDFTPTMRKKPTFIFLTVLLLLSGILRSQPEYTYVIDPNFSTEQTIRAWLGVSDIDPLDDGGFFLKGGWGGLYDMHPTSPFDNGIAMIEADGTVHPDWIGGGGGTYGSRIFKHIDGYLIPTYEHLSKMTFQGESWYSLYGDSWGDYFMAGDWGFFNNPYFVRSVSDLYILEDQSILIGGSIATDTLQPSLLRHLMRLHADGSHDSFFPIVEAMPQSLSTAISRIERTSQGYWIVSGNFSGINGHYSPHLARLTPGFLVDTSFVSPLHLQLISSAFPLHGLTYLDDEDRLWITGKRVRMADNPNDTLSIVRLLPNGVIDPSFNSAKVKDLYPQGWGCCNAKIWGITEILLEEDHFLLYGDFNNYNDTVARAIVVVDDNGNIKHNYFQGAGAVYNDYEWDPPSEIDKPIIRYVSQLEDGSLLVGGNFSIFYDENHYNLIKLNPEYLTSNSNTEKPRSIRIYPNPGHGIIEIDHSYITGSLLKVHSIDGSIVSSIILSNGRADLSHLPRGLYILEILDSLGNRYLNKWVKI